MSTVVATRKNGFAAIGADTLVKWGNTRESRDHVRNASKLVRAGESRFAVVGLAAWVMVLRSYFEKLPEMPTLASAERIFETLRELHKTLKDDYYLNTKNEDEPFESTHLWCLVANPSGIYAACAMRSVLEYETFSAMGSGYQYALGAMRAAYGTSASAEEVARVGLEAAADFDDSTAAPFEIEAITLAMPSSGDSVSGNGSNSGGEVAGRSRLRALAQLRDLLRRRN